MPGGGPSPPPLPAPSTTPLLSVSARLLSWTFCVDLAFVAEFPRLPLSFQRSSKSSSVAPASRTGVSFLPPVPRLDSSPAACSWLPGIIVLLCLPPGRDPCGHPEALRPQSSPPLLPPASPGLPWPKGWGRADRCPLGRPGPLSLPSRAVLTGRPSPVLSQQDTCAGWSQAIVEPTWGLAGCAAEGLPPRAPRAGAGGAGVGLRLVVGVKQAVGSCGNPPIISCPRVSTPHLLSSSEHPPSPVLE